MAGISLSIPQIWSAKIWEKLRPSYVYVEAFTNRDYEGELQGPGDTVKITGVGGITVAPFTGTLAPPEEISDEDKGSLQATEKDSFNFKVPILKKKQTILNILNESSAEAALSLAAAADSYVASFHADVDSGHLVGSSATPVVIGFDAGQMKPTALFREINMILSTAKVPPQNRRTVLPPWYIRALKAELSIKSTETAEQTVRNGWTGLVIDGVKIYESTEVPNNAGTKWKTLWGLNKITYADTISETQVYKPEANFDTAVKGLHVYGALMTHPKVFVCATLDPGTLEP